MENKKYFYHTLQSSNSSDVFVIVLCENQMFEYDLQVTKASSSHWEGKVEAVLN